MLAYSQFYIPERTSGGFTSPGILICSAILAGEFYWYDLWSGRPLIYAFVSHCPDALITIAALRVGLISFTISQMALNQFRVFCRPWGWKICAKSAVS